MATTIKNIENDLTKSLKAFIKQRNHYASGNLYKSIKCKFDANLKLTINAYEYLVYLEDGEFIKDFFNLPSTKESIMSAAVIKLNEPLG
jgi:DNA repair exonuclease SbcCD ATPase subunit